MLGVLPPGPTMVAVKLSAVNQITRELLSLQVNNIAARYIAYKLKLTRRNDGQMSGGKSSPGLQRMPATLSLLWDKDAPHVPQSAS